MTGGRSRAQCPPVVRATQCARRRATVPVVDLFEDLAALFAPQHLDEASPGLCRRSSGRRAAVTDGSPGRSPISLWVEPVMAYGVDLLFQRQARHVQLHVSAERFALLTMKHLELLGSEVDPAGACPRPRCRELAGEPDHQQLRHQVSVDVEKVSRHDIAEDHVEAGVGEVGDQSSSVAHPQEVLGPALQALSMARSRRS